jgi:SAM-dependent methyltransferase
MHPPQKLAFKVGDHERAVTSNLSHQGSKFIFGLVWSELLPWAPGSSLLDVGCGTHVWEATDYTVHGCDVVPVERPRFRRVEPDAPLPYRTDQFDVAMAAEVIEHTENPWLFVRELCRVAKRRVIISTPNIHCEFSRHLFMRYGFFADFTPKHRKTIGHWSPIFDWQLAEMARRAGWRVGRTDLIGGHFGNPQLPAGTLAKDLVELARCSDSKKARVCVLLPGPSTGQGSASA